MTKGKKILVVDDSQSMRQLVSYTLSCSGAVVQEADNGKAALDLVNKNQYDLILCDVNMPIMNGLAFAQEVRKLKNYKYVPLLILTTESSNDIKSKGKEAGVTGWLVKPFKPETLLATIGKVLK